MKPTIHNTIFPCFMAIYLLFAAPHTLAQKNDTHSPDAMFHEANKAYDEGNYPVAIDRYQSIIKDGYVSTETFYNLANAHFRGGAVGPAVLNYRRAWFLSPRDADVQANMNLAIQRTGAYLPAASLFQRGLRELSKQEWSTIIQISYWIALGCTLLTLVLPASRFVLKPLTIAAWIVTTGSLGGWATWNHWLKKVEAVVIVDKQTALYEPRASATPYFAVPEGSIVHMQDEFDAWVKISAGDKSGWLMKSSVERVYPWIQGNMD
jgi:tetratricopeptide (TPR) repeat protein